MVPAAALKAAWSDLDARSFRTSCMFRLAVADIGPRGIGFAAIMWPASVALSSPQIYFAAQIAAANSTTIIAASAKAGPELR